SVRGRWLDLGLFETREHFRIEPMRPDERDPMKNFRLRSAMVSASLALLLMLLPKASTAEIADWDAAVRPLDEGVPQVAVMRLRSILKRPLTPADHAIVLAKLGEALLAA